MARHTIIMLTNVLVSIVGVLTALVQQLTPARTIIKARLQKKLGPFNAIPIAVNFMNLIGWFVYSRAIDDFMLTLSCFPGALLNFPMLTTAFSLLARRTGAEHEIIKVEAIIFSGILVLGSLTWLGPVLIGAEGAKNAMGGLVAGTTIIYYASPLSSIIVVIRSQSGESMHLATILINFLGSTAWAGYGYLQNNIWIILPNAVGAAVSMISLSVKTYYFMAHRENPAKKPSDASIITVWTPFDFCQEYQQMQGLPNEETDTENTCSARSDSISDQESPV